MSHFYDELEFWGSRSDLGYTYSYENRFNLTIDLVKKAAAPPARVLDLAAAQGNFSLALAELGYHVVWNDLRAELADYVRQKYEFGSLQYLPGNIFELPAEDIGTFDVVLAAEVLEHVAHPDEFVRKLKSLLSEEGHDCPDRAEWGLFSEFSAALFRLSRSFKIRIGTVQAGWGRTSIPALCRRTGTLGTTGLPGNRTANYLQ